MEQHSRSKLTRSTALAVHTNGRTELAISEDEAWAAVLSRDHRFDGVFVTAVKTTGIYCRPSCPARHPYRDNVEFYASSEQARGHGFRACRRCHPDRLSGTPSHVAVERAQAYLDTHLDARVTLQELSEETGLSPSHLHRVFKRSVGLSPSEYQNARRLEQFKQHVGDDCQVLEATFAAGFGSSRALYKQAAAALGMTPGEYRRGGKGLNIRYTILPSPMGNVLAAATERGVCAVFLGDDEDELARHLTQEFPNAATLDRGDQALREWIEPIINYLSGGSIHPSVPLDLQGTDFQRRVWKALQDIPFGETRSYSEVAEILGSPRSTRAVANACARNKVAIAVPCHRVVRQDGGAGGYRWDVSRKKKMIAQERRRRTDT